MYKIFDLETETHTSHKRKASPFDERNWVVARGWKNQGDPKCSWEYFPTYNKNTHLTIEPHITMLVGHNIKFDLLHEMCQNNPYLHEFFKRGGRVWDTQYAEYLLRAQVQSSQMCALADTAPLYGGTGKIDEVKAMWDAGMLTAQIPEDLLIDYLVGTPEEGRNGGDIRNTELVFLGQVKAAHSKGMLLMIKDRMDGLLATTDMEFRGLKIDVKEAGRRLNELNAKLTIADEELHQYVPADLPFEFNWGSKYHVSYLIFGGTAKYQVRDTYLDEDGELARLKAKATWPLIHGQAVDPEQCELRDSGGFGTGPFYRLLLSPTEYRDQDRYLSGARKGEYKTKQVDVQGELKTKLQDRFYKFPGYTEPRDEWATKNTDAEGKPVYMTNSDVVAIIGKRDIPFLKAFGNKSALDKEIGTYYFRFDKKKQDNVGMLTCVQPRDHMLHHKLNHTSTVTTRLSSSEPNLQNIPRGDKSEAKAMFVSRFGEDGLMVEADYSQLEVVVQGVLSGDVNLCNDLRNMIDFHCKRVAKKFAIEYVDALFLCKKEEAPDHAEWKNRRTGVKEFSFQRAYGAGAQAISDATGLPIEDVRELIEAEDAMYPGVTEFNSKVEASANKTAEPFQAVSPSGAWKTYRRGYWQAPTGTLYSWRTYDAPSYAARRGATDTFMPPELKNYPVQGTGGEFVQCILGRLWRHFVSNDYYGWRAYLVNTVHDCEWTDCHKDVLEEVCRDTKRIMESIPEYYNARYGMNIDVPFPVEVEYGTNMNNLHHWKEAA